MDARGFFDLLFDDLVDKDHRLVIWSLPDKRATFHESIEAAVADANARADEADVYFGVGLVRSGIKRGRGRAADVRMISSVWADVDFGKPNGPADETAALALINRIGQGVKPTILVNSGHGFHCYWVLSEPLTEKKDASEWKASQLATAWSNYVKTQAWASKVSIDSVGDVSRVLRVPGTYNRKESSEPILITVQASASRVEFGWVTDLIDSTVAPARTKTGEAIIAGEIALREDAELSAAKLDIALEHDTRFARTWRRQRADMRDRSPSSYDMAIACFGVEIGWTDQDIANAIIHFRRKHEHDVRKAMRLDYIKRTIITARSSLAKGDSEKEVVDAADEPELDDLGAVRDDLARRLKIKISKLIKRGAEDSRYFLRLEDGREIFIGPISVLTNQAAMRNKIAETASVLPTTMKALRWDSVVGQLFRLEELVEMSDGDDQLHEWIAAYLTDHQPASGKAWAEVVPHQRPFLYDDRLHVHVIHLKRWLVHEQHEKIVTQDLRALLSAAGFACRKVSARVRGRQYCRSYWAGEWDRPVDALPLGETQKTTPAETTPF